MQTIRQLTEEMDSVEGYFLWSLLLYKALSSHLILIGN